MTPTVDPKRLAWALAKMHLWSEPDHWTWKLDLERLIMMPDAAVDALVTDKAFLYEARANHLNGYLAEYREEGEPDANYTNQDPDLKSKVERIIAGEILPESGSWDEATFHQYAYPRKAE